MSNVQWKEDNPEFGYHEISHHDEDTEKDSCHVMEFELDNIEENIVLRGKSKISHSSGLTLWTCSQVLSGYLDDNWHLVKDKTVLELGAGLGYCSIVAHHLGAKNVLATDGDIDVLENLQNNINENASTRTDENDDSYYEDSKTDGIVQPNLISCPQLIWGEDLQKFKDEYGQQQVMMGTDVLYFPACVNPLWETVTELLEKDGLFLLAFCPHSVTVDEVLDKARSYGFKWEKPNISGRQEEKDNYTSCSFGYHIFIFSRIS